MVVVYDVVGENDHAIVLGFVSGVGALRNHELVLAQEEGIAESHRLRSRLVLVQVHKYIVRLQEHREGRVVPGLICVLQPV